MKYKVVYSVTARYIAEVEADALEEATEKADSVFSAADYGDCEEVEGEIIYVEDEHGVRTDVDL